MTVFCYSIRVEMRCTHRNRARKTEVRIVRIRSVKTVPGVLLGQEAPRLGFVVPDQFAGDVAGQSVGRAGEPRRSDVEVVGDRVEDSVITAATGWAEAARQATIARHDCPI
jgi:hypothetical protein